MNISVIGGGSIGLYFTAQLALASHQLTVVCRSERQAGEIARKGIRYIDLTDSVQQVWPRTQWIEDRPLDADWIFLTVKQPQILSTIPYLKKQRADIPILCFQNGMGHEEVLRSHLPYASIYQAITTVGAYRRDPCSVQHTGQGVTYVGSLANNSETPSVLRNLVEKLDGAAVSAQIERDMRDRVWKKLIMNSCINPLTALFQVQNGELLENKHALQMMEQLYQEAVAVARLQGVEIDSNFLQEIVQVCRNTYGNKSSMLQDIESGKETEIKFINGAIVRAARHVGIEVPIHAALTQLIQAKQQYSAQR
ncbi:hypothetical protein BEP19_06670 [Ammoniphilus oxalaticus]|uniref:2-dehydropantoate 2-reductase n=1 Tax=Ammoniphilus oxalaticus TaxID=66863 RepID=A0A419SJG5_9BACL|nr:2-dehydropantoate 2-reductase [Ammoniphilus oxalaticus]RKD24086.1 hypothetical protein BEP19_06670 [Ammoniphilus oxalaticus]